MIPVETKLVPEVWSGWYTLIYWEINQEPVKQLQLHQELIAVTGAVLFHMGYRESPYPSPVRIASASGQRMALPGIGATVWKATKLDAVAETDPSREGTAQPAGSGDFYIKLASDYMKRSIY